jgi:hypothetical protein
LCNFRLPFALSSYYTIKKKELNMTIIAVKKVIQIGGSVAITLPKEWAKDHVKPGDEMYIVATDELHIAKVPQKTKSTEKKVEEPKEVEIGETEEIEKEEDPKEGPLWYHDPVPYAGTKSRSRV